MQLQQAVRNTFLQLSQSLESITPDQYTEPCDRLGKSTIGQHVRHIIEMFQCLEKGYETGLVNYEQRPRDPQIEARKDLALRLLGAIAEGLAKQDKSLFLEGVYDTGEASAMTFQTNYYREIVYNLEHTIHHMALIRVGLQEMAIANLPDSYGVAPATVKHKAACAP